MEVTIMRGRSWSEAKFSSKADRDEAFDALNDVISYEIPGAEFSEKFEMGVWDGRGRLHYKVRGAALAIRFPTGVIDLVYLKFYDLGYAIKAGVTPEEVYVREDCAPFEWMGFDLRWYQREAVDAIKSRIKTSRLDPLIPPGGIIRLPMRSGKTLLAAKLIQEIGVRTLFITPSDHLFRQTYAEFVKDLGEDRVSKFGAGTKDSEGDVVVCTVQTLVGTFGTKQFERLKQRISMVIVDEAHHAGGDAGRWREVIMLMKADIIVALSATFELEDTAEERTNGIWIRGLTGPIAYSKMPSDLMPEFLAPLEVRWYEHGAEKVRGKGAGLIAAGIVDCEARNAKIVELAVKMFREGHIVLVDAAQIRHVRALHLAIKKEIGKSAAFAVGPTTVPTREKISEELVTNGGVLVSNVFGEGVDIPPLSVVINAEGGRGYVPCMQRLRCMTKWQGKEIAYLIDFIDSHHRVLLGASEDRFGVYDTEEKFSQVYMS